MTHAPAVLGGLASTALHLALHGDTGDDDLRVNHRGEHDVNIRLTAFGSTSRDRIEANFRFDAGSSGRIGNGVPSVIDGGLGDDLLRYAVFVNEADRSVVRVDATVEGGAGRDRCDRTSNVASVRCEQDFIPS